MPSLEGFLNPSINLYNHYILVLLLYATNCRIYNKFKKINIFIESFSAIVI